MSYIGNAPGLAQRNVFRFLSTTGQTVFSGVDATGFVLSYKPGLVDVFLNGSLLATTKYGATNGSSITLNTSPAADSELIVIAAGAFSPADTYTRDEARVAFSKKRNRIIDPGMRISQENGNTAVSSGYPSDSFSFTKIGQGNATAQRVNLPTPGGSPNRIRVVVTQSSVSPAAGDYTMLSSTIEGFQVADLKFGTASARKITVRMGVRSSVAGTFPVSIRSIGGGRSWLGSITIAQNEVNVDVVKVLTLSGDVVGTWAKDNTIGMYFGIGFAIGTNLRGLAGWQTGNKVGLEEGINFLASLGQFFELFDVGLYEGDVAPEFELASYGQDLRECQRYYFNLDTNGAFGFPREINQNQNANFGVSPLVRFPVTMRAVPTVSIVWNINDELQSSPPSSPVSTTDGWTCAQNLAPGRYMDIRGFRASARL